MSYRILAIIDVPGTGVSRVIAATESTEVKETSSDSHTTAEDTHAQADSHSETSTHTTEETHSEESQGIAALGLDPVAIGAQFVTFLVLFIVIRKFVLKGIVANLQKRHEDINRGLHLTAELDKQKADLDERVESALRSARKEADKIIADAHAETGKMIQAAEEKAGVKAEEIILAAEGKIERDIIEARNGLKKEMAALITEATEAILQEKLDTSADKKLVEKYMNEAKR